MATENPVTFGENLRHWREACDVTQIELARFVGVDQSHMAHLEKGDSMPGLLTVRDIAICLDIPMNALVMGVVFPVKGNRGDDKY